MGEEGNVSSFQGGAAIDQIVVSGTPLFFVRKAQLIRTRGWEDPKHGRKWEEGGSLGVAWGFRVVRGC